MILYYTGTGNSFDIAKRLSKELGDDLVSLSKRMQSTGNEPFLDVHRFIFVTPIYMGRIPKVVTDFLRYSNFRGSNEVYFIVTCSNSSFHALHYLQKLVAEKGWVLRGFDYVKMPIGYYPKFKASSDKEIAKLLEKAHHHAEKISREIEAGHTFIRSPRLGLTVSLSGYLYFDQHGFNPRFFSANEACNSCGDCVLACPLHDIEISQGLPIWGKACNGCMACLNTCPKKAIEFKNKSVGKKRYINPDYHPF
jgi:NAD-dependent dihydropyrimidine dehydrogenase PreA subunit/menaquinone-dependent protoporphyrinogen IX oxidase